MAIAWNTVRIECGKGFGKICCDINWNSSIDYKQDFGEYSLRMRRTSGGKGFLLAPLKFQAMNLIIANFNYM